MDPQFTEYVLIEELPSVSLFLLDSSQDSFQPLCSGPLLICRILVSNTFFLSIPPDFRYALSKSIQVLRAKDKRYILPTNQRGVMYGITVNDPVKAKIHILDVVLEDNCEFVVHKPTVSDSVSTVVTKGGSWLAKGIRKSAALAVAGYTKGREKIGKMLEERRERKKQEARARVEAKSEGQGQRMAMPEVATMFATSQAISSTQVEFAPAPPSAPLLESARSASSSVSSAVSEVASSASHSARSLADRVVQNQLGLSGGTQDLMAGLRLLSATAAVVGKYVDPETALRVAAGAARVVTQARPPA